jgi:uncharacterized protein
MSVRRAAWVAAAMAVAGVLAACSGGSSPGAAPSGSATRGPRATVAGSEVRTLESKAAGRTFQLEISYPDGYGSGPATYPVVYVLDSQWDFKLVRAIYENELYDNQLPELIVVGITYPGDVADYGPLRNHDLTPFVEGDVEGSGGGAAFLTFLRTELLPYVDKNLRSDPKQRYLVGSSYGGLFTLYALFSDPSLFRGYLAGSPVVQFANGALVNQEEQYFAGRKDLPTRLFVPYGTKDQLSGSIAEFVQHLKARKYRGLEFADLPVQGEGHAGNRAEAFSRGLRYLFGNGT